MTIVNNNGHLATEIWTDSAHLSSETVETLFHANCPRSSPMIDAVEQNCLSSALEIMKSELAVNQCIFRNGEITSVLSTAVSTGTLEMLNALLKGIKEVVEVVVDVQLPDTKCGLNHLAVHRGDEKVKLHCRLPCHRSDCVLQVLQALLDADCSVNSKQAQGNTPLMVAISKIRGGLQTELQARKNDVLKMVYTLIKFPKAELDTQNNSSLTALHMAVQGDLPGIFKSLIEAGCSVNVQNDLGNTPFMDAVASSRAEMVALMLPTADLGINNSKGDTALHIAIEKWDWKKAKASIPEDLIEKSNMEISNQAGYNVWQWAVQHNRVGLANRILMDVKPEARKEARRTARKVSSKKSMPQSVKARLQAKVELKAPKKQLVSEPAKEDEANVRENHSADQKINPESTKDATDQAEQVLRGGKAQHASQAEHNALMTEKGTAGAQAPVAAKPMKNTIVVEEVDSSAAPPAPVAVKPKKNRNVVDEVDSSVAPAPGAAKPKKNMSVVEEVDMSSMMDSAAVAVEIQAAEMVKARQFVVSVSALCYPVDI